MQLAKNFVDSNETDNYLSRVFAKIKGNLIYLYHQQMKQILTTYTLMPRVLIKLYYQQL
jgi:hypothetical protein